MPDPVSYTHLDVYKRQRYVRLRLTKTGTTTPNKANYWTKVREFTVNKKFTDGERIYTNIEKLKETPIHIYENEFRIRDIKDLELKPNEYVLSLIHIYTRIRRKNRNNRSGRKLCNFI